MKLSVSAYRAHALAHKKILSGGYHSHFKCGKTIAAATVAASTASSSTGLFTIDNNSGLSSEMQPVEYNDSDSDVISASDSSSADLGQSQANPNYNIKTANSSFNAGSVYSLDKSGPQHRKSHFGDGNSDPDSDGVRSNQRWMKLRTTVQISSAIQKKPALKREDSFLKRFSTRHISDTQEAVEDSGSEGGWGITDKERKLKHRQRYLQRRLTVVNPDENFYFYWLMLLTVCVLYNLWTLIVRQSFPELQQANPSFWLICDSATDVVFIIDILVQLRTGYLEQGLMVYDDKKLASHYMYSKNFVLDLIALAPFDLLQMQIGVQPLLRFPRFFKAYRSIRFYYIVESRTVWPNLWRVINLIHILLILAHWFGCFYYLLSEAEGFQGDWVYPYRPGDYATLTRKYLGSLYWSTLTLTTIGDLPTPETNAEYIFTIVSYLIGVFIFATIVGQVGNVITNRNANRLEFERLLDGAKTYMRHHKVPGGMKRRVLRWYDYSWSRGRMQGGGDINTALGLLPDKLKTELALHVNLSVLKKVTIFQECQPEFLHDLVLKMKAYIFTPGDSICRKGEVAREMFIIADGILEVLSETGKVLTTMKAGDFFGEIGILNLDGLNKRTADVRSVGYSELFSLSREDVLAAMKDYPEAQEILQTLGRKRLKEVRCVNKKYAKLKSDKDASSPGSNHQQKPAFVSQSTSSETIPKKPASKFKYDNKCSRSSLRKSKIFRKNSNDLYVDLFSEKLPKSEVKTSKEECGLQFDDKEGKTDKEHTDIHHEKTLSKIGAGLPLLQRLRLLKEQQDREDRAVSTTPTTQNQATSNTLVTCPLSSQESIQEEPEHEGNDDLLLANSRQQCHKSIKKYSLPSTSTQLPIINSSNNITKAKDISTFESNLDSILSDSKTNINPYSKSKLSTLTSTSSCINLIGFNSFPSDTNSESNVLAHKLLFIENRNRERIASSVHYHNKLISDSYKRVSPQSSIAIVNGPIDSYHKLTKTEYYKSSFNLCSGQSYKNPTLLKHSTKLDEQQLLAISKLARTERSFSEKLQSAKGPKNKLSESKPLQRSQSITLGMDRQQLIVCESDSGTSSHTSTSRSDNFKTNTNYHIPPCLDAIHPLEEHLPLELELKEAIIGKQLPLDVNYNQVSSNIHKLSQLTKDEGIDVLFKGAVPHLSTAVVDNYTTLTNSISTSNGHHLKAVNKYQHLQQVADHLPINNKGLLEEQQSLKEILIGINNTVRIHIKDMQSKFRSQFSSMADEVQKRDIIIARLQAKLQDLELNMSLGGGRKRCNWEQCKYRNPSKVKYKENRSSSVSSDELLFMRHDSLDTVFTTSPPFGSANRRNIPNHTSLAKPISKSEKSQQQSDTINNHNKNNNNSKDVQNVQYRNENVILDIGSSTSSNSSFDRLHHQETAEGPFLQHNPYPYHNRVHHDDWELKMLAAELDKRKRTRSLSDHLPKPFKRHRSRSL